MQGIERTNQRDGTTYLLLLSDGGLPQCPHCGTEMSRSGDSYENSNCSCWWAGAKSGIYPLQVVIAAEPEGEAAYRQSVADYHAQKNAEDLARKSAVAQLGALLESAGWTPRPTLKQRWAGHWHRDGYTVLARKIPQHGGDHSLSYEYGQPGKNPIVSCVRLDGFLRQFLDALPEDDPQAEMDKAYITGLPDAVLHEFYDDQLLADNHHQWSTFVASIEIHLRQMAGTWTLHHP